MKLHVAHRFSNVTLERFVDVYFSEAFNNAVAAVSGLKTRALVSDTVASNGLRHRRVRMTPDIALPASIAKLVSREPIAWDEVNVYDAATHTARYHIDSAAKERVQISGDIRFVADADGVRRIIDGTIHIKAPLGLGMLVERFVEDQTAKGYAKIAVFLQRWLDDHA